MARLEFSGFETGNEAETISIGGTLPAGYSIQTTIAHNSNTDGGAYALKEDGASTTSGIYYIMAAATGLSRIFPRAYFYLATLGAGTDSVSRLFSVDGVGMECDITLSWANASSQYTIQLRDNVGIKGTFTWTAAKAAQWYRLEADVTNGASTGIAKVYLDGALIINVSGLTFANTQWLDFYVGGAFTATTRAVCYFDDCAIDDAALPGPGYIISRQFSSTTPTYDAWTKSTGSTIDTVWNTLPVANTNNANDAVNGDAQTGVLSPINATQSGHGNGVINNSDLINSVKRLIQAKAASAGGLILLRRRINSVDSDISIGTYTTTDTYYKGPLFTPTVADMMNSPEFGIVHAADSVLETVYFQIILIDFTPNNFIEAEPPQIVRAYGIVGY